MRTTSRGNVKAKGAEDEEEEEEKRKGKKERMEKEIGTGRREEEFQDDREKREMKRRREGKNKAQLPTMRPKAMKLLRTKTYIHEKKTSPGQYCPGKKYIRKKLPQTVKV